VTSLRVVKPENRYGFSLILIRTSVNEVGCNRIAITHAVQAGPPKHQTVQVLHKIQIGTDIFEIGYVTNREQRRKSTGRTAGSREMEYL